MSSPIEKRKEQLKKYIEAREKATEGPWGDMFIGGPMNPRVDVYSVGREGSHHILVKLPDEHVKSGFFKKGDASFIALAANKSAKIARDLLDALEALGLCHRRMKMTAWVEDECFEKADELLTKLSKGDE